MPRPSPVFKTPTDRALYLAHHAHRLATHPHPLEPRRIPTRHGDTSLLLTGAPDAPRLIVLHGGNGSALDMAAAWTPLTTTHRVAWIDIPGDPNPSAETRLDKGTSQPGEWLADLLDALDWPTTAIAALSGGGAHALRAAAHIPERITRLALIVPQGLALAPLPTLIRRVLWPLWRARRRPDDRNIRRLLAALCTGPINQDTIDHFERVLRHCHGAEPPAPRITPADLARFTAPTLIAAAGRDVLFPGPALLTHARRVIRGPLTEVWLEDAGHLDPRYFAGGEVFERMHAFLAD